MKEEKIQLGIQKSFMIGGTIDFKPLFIFQMLFLQTQKNLLLFFAEKLKLNGIELYTSHTMRRTGASLLAEGGSIQLC